jgi:two-component system, cell cycle response regulator
MYKVDWNDGMSVGVDAIDNDHKRLLNTINRLYLAIDNSATEVELELIFSELENYVVEHFVREEALLRKCHYEGLDEHIVEHKKFAAKVPELKAKLLQADNYLVAQEVSMYLTDWLLNHIITEDHDAIESFRSCGIIKEEKIEKTFLQKIVTTLTVKLSFARRMLFAILVPLLGMLILGVIIVREHHLDYQNMNNIHQLSKIALDLNALTHHI